MATVVSRQSTIVQKIEDETLEEIGSMKRVKLIIFVVPLIYFCGVYALFHLPVLFHHPSHASLQPSSFTIFNHSLFEFTLPSATVLNDSPPVSWFAFALPSHVKSHAPRDLLPSVLPTIVASPMGPAIDVVHFCWALAFFATFFIDFSSGLSAGSNDPLRRGMAMLLCTVNFMAMITYTLARFHLLPLHTSAWTNMPLLSARYMQWTCSCGTLLYMMGYMGRVPFKSRYRAIGYQVTMIVSGFLGTYLWRPLNLVMFVVSMVTWVFVLRSINHFLSDAERYCLHKDDAPRVKTLRIYSLVVWSLFPLFWCMGEFGLLRPFTSELLIACVDIGAKVIYSAMLYWTNLMSFERFEMLRAISSATDFSDAEQTSKAQERIASLQRMVSLVCSTGVMPSSPPSNGQSKVAPVDIRALVAKGSHRLSAFQSRFLERIKTEFKNPLNSVVQLTASVLSAQIDDQHRARLQGALAGAQTLLLNIDNMLALSEAEKLAADGKTESEQQPFQLYSMLDALTDFGAQRAGDKLQQLELVVSFDPLAPSALSADFRRLFLVIRNLLDNSIKFTQRGFVLVHASVVSSTVADECTLQVICQDSGNALLFPYEQMGVDAPADVQLPPHSDNGLGLLVVRALVAAMKGTVQVAPPTITSTGEDNCDGTTITIRVPVRRLSDSEAETAGFVVPSSQPEAATPTPTLRMPPSTPLMAAGGLRQRGRPVKYDSDDSNESPAVSRTPSSNSVMPSPSWSPSSTGSDIDLGRDGKRALSAVICVELPLLRDVLTSFVTLAGANVRVVQSGTQVAQAVLQSVDVLIVDAELLSSTMELASLIPAALRQPTTLIEIHSMLSSSFKALQGDLGASRESPTVSSGKGAKMKLAGASRVPASGANANLLRHYLFSRPIKMSSLLQVLRMFVADMARRHAVKSNGVAPSPM